MVKGMNAVAVVDPPLPQVGQVIPSSWLRIVSQKILDVYPVLTLSTLSKKWKLPPPLCQRYLSSSDRRLLDTSQQNLG